MSPDKNEMVDKINYQIGQIDKLLEKYSDLIKESQQNPPNHVEITALASVLHSFYHGLENIFSIMAKEMDGNLPKEENWHKKLLSQMAQAKSNRTAIISKKTQEKLGEYLTFRHFYRHSYSYFLDWARMNHLVYSLNETWERAKIEIKQFIKAST